MRMSVRSFSDEHERETWKGLQSAYRNGVKCRVSGAAGKYGFRADFQAAWQRGWAAADAFLAGGGELYIPEI